MSKKPYIIGNWKMNLAKDDARDIASAIAANAKLSDNVVLCPPFPMLNIVAEFVGDGAIKLGAQDCHYEKSGAYTGDVSADMLKEADCAYVIVGHSERREYHGETSEVVGKKAEAAIKAGLKPVICVGESLQSREADETLSVIRKQLSASIPQKISAAKIIIAYEPVWAIGTGLTPTSAQIEEVHNFIHSWLEDNRAVKKDAMHVLYGGSVKAENAEEILGLDGVGGALVGGASIIPEQFNAIIKAGR